MTQLAPDYGGNRVRDNRAERGDIMISGSDSSNAVTASRLTFRDKIDTLVVR